MSKTIWYVSKYVAPPGSGTSGGRGYLLMKELAKLGHRVVFITSDSNQLADPPRIDGDYLIQSLDGMQLCWVRTFKYEIAKSVRRTLSWIHFEWRLIRLPKHHFPNPEVVVVSSLSLLTVLHGLWWRTRYSCRLVFEVRDIWPLTIIEEGGFKPFNPFVYGLGLIERLGYRYADAIVGTMPNLGEHVQQVLGFNKVVNCIPMGVDAEMFASSEPLPADYCATYFPKGKFVVAHVGSIGITNALDTFLQCAQTMEDNHTIHFLLIGDGDLREIYRQKYAHLNNLSFGPRIPKSMVQSALLKCDLLYFSAHVSKVWKYGQSLNKIIDYMMSGKPILASYTGYRSMLNEADCGSYVPAGDLHSLRQEIIRYASLHEEERKLIGSRGRRWLLKNRSYHNLAVQYLKIMEGNFDA